MLCQAAGTPGLTHCCYQPWGVHFCCLWPLVAPACFSWPLFIHCLWSGWSFQLPTCAGGSDQPTRVPFMVCQRYLCLLTLYTDQNLQSKQKKVPSLRKMHLICFSLLLSHSCPVSLAALLFQGWPGSCVVPSPRCCLGVWRGGGSPTLPTQEHFPGSFT